MVWPKIFSFQKYFLPTILTGQYDMHMSRQEADVRAFMEDESFVLDPSLDYSSVSGLSSEVIEKLNLVRPTTIVSFKYPIKLFAFANSF